MIAAHKFVHKIYMETISRISLGFGAIFPSESSTIRGGGAVAQSVERATPGEEVLCSIPAVATHSLLVGFMSV